jgi:hypothetical protein
MRKLLAYSPLLLALVACSSSKSAGAGGGDDGTDGGTDAPLGPDGGLVGPLCTVTAGTSGTLLTGTLLLPSGPVTGELLIDSTGTITCADASCSSSTGYSAATRIDCPYGVISPSLINTHDHTEYATAAPYQLGSTRYECRSEWRTGADSSPKIPYSDTNDPATIAAQEMRFVLSGATSVMGSSGVGGLLRNLADYDNPTFVEGLTGSVAYFDVFPLGDTNGVEITSGCAYPSIISTKNAFEDGVFAPHISEGINAAAANELTCCSQASNNLVTSDTTVLHGVAVNATSVNVIAQAKARLVWAPRSNIDLYGDTAPVTVYATEGVPISLGTDWLPSGSMNMLRELYCADTFNRSYLNGTFTDQQLWQMVTSNAATATGFDSQIGSLVAGKVADVAIFDGSVNTTYRAVIAAGVEDVHLVLRGGKVLYGDTPLVSALDSTCTPFSVCGGDRSVCVDTPSITLADIQAAAAKTYPLFFCKGQTPTAEPSCTPYRETYANGITATDKDGDGVDDASDDCPDIFNPIRPMDNGQQADVDGDGVGDVCDAHPLDPGSH